MYGCRSVGKIKLIVNIVYAEDEFEITFIFEIENKRTRK